MKNGGKNKSVAFIILVSVYIYIYIYIYIDDINKSYTVPSTETFCLDRIRIHRLLLLKPVLSKKGEQISFCCHETKWLCEIQSIFL